MLTQFDSMLEQLQVEQGIKESNFHHVFNSDKILGNDSQSPYMQVNDENDKVVLTTDKCFVLPDGQATGVVEQKTLENSIVPGVNNRIGMPKAAAKKQAVREADQDAIVQFCKLPEAQTKRCLILKAFEKMMQKKQPEQTFSFLDRNYVEEFKEKSTMR